MMQAVDLEDVPEAIFYILAARHKQELRQIGELSKLQKTILDALRIENHIIQKKHEQKEELDGTR